MWPYIMILTGLIAAGLFVQIAFLYRNTTDLFRFRQARGLQLVKYIEWIYCRKGYKLTYVKYVAELEVEVILEKNSVVTMLQIKQRKGKVTKSMVEFLYTIALKEDCDWAVIISPAGFRGDARQLARDLGITLHNGKWLRGVLKGCRIKPAG